MFETDFFVGNRERLRRLFTGTAPIVVTANGLLQRGSDEPFPFHQESNFWYLTGLNDPDLVLVMDKTKEYLIVPSRSASRETFDGAVEADELTRRSGIATILPEKEGWKQLEHRLKRVQHVATLAAPPAFIEDWGLYTNPARATLVKRIKLANADADLLDLRPHLQQMRMIKQTPEIAAIQQAIDITSETLKKLTRPTQLAKYKHEFEIEADLTRGFRRGGAAGHAFSPIVAGGRRACTLHNTGNEAALNSGDLLVLDVGAEVSHYAADITRTVALGEVSKRHHQVHEAVQRVQEYAFSLLKPGVIQREYEKQVETFMGEKLRELGLIKSITSESVREYFPHATSHFLGLDTHDAGDYTKPLEAGVVMTVEPGIYIDQEGIGVRIEDDVLITETGIQILSDRLPRELI